MAIEGVPVGVDGSAAGTVVGAPDLAGSLTVSEIHQLLDEAVRSAGLVHLWVTGTVTGLRPGPKFTTFELVDYEDDGATVRAVLSVGVFAGLLGRSERPWRWLAPGWSTACRTRNGRYPQTPVRCEQVARIPIGAKVIPADPEGLRNGIGPDGMEVPTRSLRRVQPNIPIAHNGMRDLGWEVT